MIEAIIEMFNNLFYFFDLTFQEQEQEHAEKEQEQREELKEE